MFQSEVLVIVIVILSVKIGNTNPILYHDDRLYEGSKCELSNGGRGVCTLSANCTNNLKNHKKIVICGYQKELEIICCPYINYTGPYPSLAQACADRSRKLDDELLLQHEMMIRVEKENRVFHNYRRKSSSTLQKIIGNQYDECRYEAERLFDNENLTMDYIYKCWSRTLHSDQPFMDIYESVRFQHPHIAALGWFTSPDQISWHCGGALIHRSFVITAAHCMKNLGRTPDIIRIGDTRLIYPLKKEAGINYQIEQVFIHEEYKEPAYYNDIAMIKVKKMPEYRYTPSPIHACLWMEESIPINHLLGMGYGASEFGRSYNEKLYEGNLTILPNSLCEGYYQRNELLPKGLVDSQLCAYDPAKNLDTCEGDSGGPLQFNAKDLHRTPYIGAITSFGRLCLDGSPGVYTRIHSHLDWIENIITENF